MSSNVEVAIIEAVADAMYPYWLTNGNDVKGALMSVHQNHPVRAIRDQAWSSHQFAIEMPIVWEAHRLAMEKRAAVEHRSTG